jgi:hypothetical protein
MPFGSEFHALYPSLGRSELVAVSSAAAAAKARKTTTALACPCIKYYAVFRLSMDLLGLLNTCRLGHGRLVLHDADAAIAAEPSWFKAYYYR